MDDQQDTGVRKLIIDRATTIFAEKGYHAATMRDVAKAAGLALGTIHYYFPSKEAILKTVLSRGTGGRPVFEASAAIAAEPRPVEERLRSLIGYLVAENLKFRDRFLVMLHEVRYLLPDDRAALKHALRERREIIEQLIAEGVEAGVFQTDDHAFFALILLQMIDSINLWHRSGGGRSPEGIADGIAEFALNGLLKRDPAWTMSTRAKPRATVSRSG